jgi:hypothetical protein
MFYDADTDTYVTEQIALESGDAPDMPFGLGTDLPRRGRGRGGRAGVQWLTRSASAEPRQSTPAPPPPPPPALPGFAIMGQGNCLPNLPQWYNMNISDSGCAAVCAATPACLGYDWGGRDCRVRFPLPPTTATALPPGFTRDYSSKVCANISGADGGASASCYRRDRSPSSSQPFECPQPPPPSGLTVVLAGTLPGAHGVWAPAPPAPSTARAAAAAEGADASVVDGMMPVGVGSSWRTWMLIAPANANFPAGAASLPPSPSLSRSDTVGGGMPAADVEALLTGAYGSAVGCLCTYDGGGMAATTIDRPGRGYPGVSWRLDDSHTYGHSVHACMHAALLLSPVLGLSGCVVRRPQAG